MLNRGVNARDGIGALRIVQVYFWIDTADVVVSTAHQCAFAGKLHLFAIAESQRAPYGFGIEC